ncbi:AEC family transporter [Aggregicoccus sp. 17bor-14]|uniref:AEC family transporter n=1 Tax=Myxococcaceae TaxID=31 RepID=UPI00129CBA88|nr:MULTISPECIES: AEC family transporter [Myxococcaceae]MBF5043050.1 AEC family transporter [Simulacricoccus sp. 17bor-14]MRI88813.1 AEC family transporter [Aggregicoccus sp. 17bor-14]
MSVVLGLLGGCLLLGALARRSARFPANTPLALNAFVMNVALPALVLNVVHALHVRPALLAAAAAPWGVFFGSLLLVRLTGARLGLSPQSQAALALTAGLGNTSFVGLPMAEALLGPKGVEVAVVVDQLGSFLALATVASAVAARASSGGGSGREVLRRVLTFPSFIALVLAFATHAFAYPAWLDTSLARLGALLTPLALFSVGFSLRLSGLSAHRSALAVGLGYKMLLAPLVTALLFRLLPSGDPVLAEATVLQVGTAPMVSAALLAAERRLDPELATRMVGLGIPLSLLSAPALLWLMRACGM